ncbi:MAG: hypothetical protein MJ068_02485 [Clostridia bacterium]|nr:hypothetical protein [Clostridia bacterium]
MKKIISLVIVLSLVLSCFIALTSCNKKDGLKPEWWDNDSWINDEFNTIEYTPETLTDYIGGFACGVCHPNENYEQIADANIQWVRFDINNLPFTKDGQMNPGYLAFKERAKSYADRGFKVMAVTPYPEDYIEFGLDPRDESSKAEIMKIARFYAEDLQGIVSALQITNEMGLPRFTEPLNIDEAAEFIGIQAKAIYRYKKGIALCYNLGGVEGYVQLTTAMEPWEKYIDFVGVDFYLGCFDGATGMLGVSGGAVFTGLAYDLTGKPIMVNEFGYIGYGEPKTDAEKLEILQYYGAQGDTLPEAITYTQNNIKDFIENENFPESFREDLELVCGLPKAKNEEEVEAAYRLIASKLFNDEYTSHLYCQLAEDYVVKGYPHSPEGQAEYMTDQIDVLASEDFICGTIVYCYSDSAKCYVCGQEKCPVETGWGLVDGKGNPKPLYYAIQKAFGDIRGIND